MTGLTKQNPQAKPTLSAGGLIVAQEQKTISISPQDLELTQNFFCADHFRVKQNGPNLEILFTQVIPFSTEEAFTLAINVAFPIQMAISSFYEVVWDLPASSGLSPFGNTLSEVAKQSAQMYGTAGANAKFDSYKLPPNENVRKFAANFATCAYSNGEATIDFYQASPQLIHLALNHNTIRKGDKIQNIFGVIITVERLYEFLLACREILAPFSKVKTKEV